MSVYSSLFLKYKSKHASYLTGNPYMQWDIKWAFLSTTEGIEKDFVVYNFTNLSFKHFMQPHSFGIRLSPSLLLFIFFYPTLEHFILPIYSAFTVTCWIFLGAIRLVFTTSPPINSYGEKNSSNREWLLPSSNVARHPQSCQTHWEVEDYCPRYYSFIWIWLTASTSSRKSMKNTQTPTINPVKMTE